MDDDNEPQKIKNPSRILVDHAAAATSSIMVQINVTISNIIVAIVACIGC
jgi:hypothetical protein